MRIPTASLRMVYSNAREMDSQIDFYRRILGGDPMFRDGTNWTEFQLQSGRFALSGLAESALGGAGAVAVFENDRMPELEKLLRSQGRCICVRDMRVHGRVLTGVDPEGTIFQIFSKAALGHEHAGDRKGEAFEGAHTHRELASSRLLHAGRSPHGPSSPMKGTA